MPKYQLFEPRHDLDRNIPVHSFEELAIHHPKTNANAVRAGDANSVDSEAAFVNGELEAVRIRNGNILVKKDIIFQDQSGSRNVNIPAPVSGYIDYLRDPTQAVRIFDKPESDPSRRLIGQVLHMDPSSFNLREGSYVQYGQPLGRQSDTGSHGATHGHIEVEAGQFRKYIQDLNNGVITQETYPAIGSVQAAPTPATTIQASPLADGVLRQGERGPEIAALQTRLNALGFKDDRGNALVPDGDFGNSTKQAVIALQRARDLDDDGIVGKDTFAALGQTAPIAQTPAPSAAVQPQTGVGTTALSNLIGSGEGDYNSYNRGVAGDSRTPINLSDMTIAEIMRRQDLPRNDPDRLFAVGKFQIIPGTMEETVRNLGLDTSQKFTPALQERMFADYLVDEKRPAVKAYITGQSNGEAGLDRAQLALAQEFASVASPRTGRSYYDGDSGGNHSSITTTQVETALNQMRAQYQTNINNGQTPDAAYRALNGQAQGQTTAPMQITGALSDGVLKKGEHGPEIAVLQTQLNALGFKDAKGNALMPDGDFGERTKQAVEAFQRSRDLVDDGVVGKDTLAALKKAEAASVAPPLQQVAPARYDQAPLLSHPNHPDHALYQQALTGIEKLPANTFKNELERQNAAASVAFEAKVSGLTRVDTVALSTNGAGLFAVQGAMSDPAHNRVYIDKAQAAGQSVEKSTQQLQQESLLSVQAVQTQEHQKKSMVV